MKPHNDYTKQVKQLKELANQLFKEDKIDQMDTIIACCMGRIIDDIQVDYIKSQGEEYIGFIFAEIPDKKGHITFQLPERYAETANLDLLREYIAKLKSVMNEPS